jgi:hypothetical protein
MMNVKLRGSPDVFNSSSFMITDLDGNVSFGYVITDIDKKIAVSGNSKSLGELAKNEERSTSKPLHRKGLSPQD